MYKYNVDHITICIYLFGEASDFLLDDDGCHHHQAGNLQEMTERLKISRFVC